MRDRLRTTMAAALVGTALLSGCSERQEASATLPSASEAPSTSEAALPPLGPPDLPMPDEARAQTPEGAQAFVRYYIELINRTSTVMDAAPLRDLSVRCEDCNRIAKYTEEDAAAGRDYEGGEMTIADMGEPRLKGGTAEMTVAIDQARFIVLDDTGKPTEGGIDPLTEVYGGAGLSWDAPRQTWVMTQLTFG
ncbi:DUF6318 family protein [Geodermatophilus sp. DSM 44513]|uniref:DUF6318 family protein n=1 Tax=Geodermatophilus sp. DSM 44513 TaxID=1528104 RepID=UPI0014123EA5|nr:DUF6318 family protein [Geodermatophilus sp. DSM 44513]WNV74142.1 DUF6318 family protein [Geodermatophilus sp. DSM 44513]